MKFFPLIALLIVLVPVPVTAEVVSAVDENTGLRSWQWREAGISIQFIQRLPDRTRAFFQARGFTAAQADRIARTCVFQSIFRNDGDQPLSYNLDDWQVDLGSESRAMLTRERWDEIWQGTEASEAARIALRWSLLPTRQRFEAGDYNWGMTSFGLTPGQSFDLAIRQSLDGHSLTGLITGMTCAADREGG